MLPCPLTLAPSVPDDATLKTTLRISQPQHNCFGAKNPCPPSQTRLRFRRGFGAHRPANRPDTGHATANDVNDAARQRHHAKLSASRFRRAMARWNQARFPCEQCHLLPDFRAFFVSARVEASDIAGNGVARMRGACYGATGAQWPNKVNLIADVLSVRPACSRDRRAGRCAVGEWQCGRAGSVSNNREAIGFCCNAKHFGGATV